MHGKKQLGAASVHQYYREQSWGNFFCFPSKHLSCSWIWHVWALFYLDWVLYCLIHHLHFFCTTAWSKNVWRNYIIQKTMEQLQQPSAFCYAMLSPTANSQMWGRHSTVASRKQRYGMCYPSNSQMWRKHSTVASNTMECAGLLSSIPTPSHPCGMITLDKP